MLAGPTLLTVRTAVTDLGYSQLAASVVDGAIRAGYRRALAVKRWPFLETQTAALVTVAGTPSVALTTTDLLHVHAVRLAIGTEYVEVDYMELETLRDQRHGDTTPSVPLYWTQANGTIEFYPTPDRVYTLTVDYSTFPSMPAADGDVLNWPSAHMDVLVWAAVSRLCFRQRDPASKAQADGEYQTQLSEMRSAYNIRQRQTSQQVKRSDFWDSAVY